MDFERVAVQNLAKPFSAYIELEIVIEATFDYDQNLLHRSNPLQFCPQLGMPPQLPANQYTIASSALPNCTRRANLYALTAVDALLIMQGRKISGVACGNRLFLANLRTSATVGAQFRIE
jgi:hypothetical protein